MWYNLHQTTVWTWPQLSDWLLSYQITLISSRLCHLSLKGPRLRQIVQCTTFVNECEYNHVVTCTLSAVSNKGCQNQECRSSHDEILSVVFHTERLCNTLLFSPSAQRQNDCQLSLTVKVHCTCKGCGEGEDFPRGQSFREERKSFFCEKNNNSCFYSQLYLPFISLSR